jgi:hypothetical protein
MNTRIAAIRHRRALLVARSDFQRLELAVCLAPWRRPLAVVDTVMTVVRTYSTFSTLGALFVARAPRRGLLSWAGRLLAAWEVVRLVRREWQRRRH